MFDFLASINWTTVIVTVIAVILVFNLIQIIKLYMRKKYADKELKRIEGQIEDVKAQLKGKQKKLEEILKKGLPKKPPPKP